MAYKTWKLFVTYLYTGVTIFPPSSGRSLFRLADRAGMPELKEAILKQYGRSLTPQTAVDMAFDRFSAQYPEILDANIAYLKAHLPADAEVKKQIGAKVSAVMMDEGQKHGQLAVSKVISILF